MGVGYTVLKLVKEVGLSEEVTFKSQRKNILSKSSSKYKSCEAENSVVSLMPSQC